MTKNRLNKQNIYIEQNNLSGLYKFFVIIFLLGFLALVGVYATGMVFVTKFAFTSDKTIDGKRTLTINDTEMNFVKAAAVIFWIEMTYIILQFFLLPKVYTTVIVT